MSVKNPARFPARSRRVGSKGNKAFQRASGSKSKYAAPGGGPKPYTPPALGK